MYLSCLIREVLLGQLGFGRKCLTELITHYCYFVIVPQSEYNGQKREGLYGELGGIKVHSFRPRPADLFQAFECPGGASAIADTMTTPCQWMRRQNSISETTADDGGRGVVIGISSTYRNMSVHWVFSVTAMQIYVSDDIAIPRGFVARLQISINFKLS